VSATSAEVTVFEISAPSRLAATMRIPVTHVHRFAVGETVLFTERRAGMEWKAGYTVVAHVEPDDLGLKYQIRSTNRSHTRTAHEHELSATD
jgi:hypothetical protein